MLVLPPGHAETLRVAHRVTPREKWILGAVLAGVAALLAAVVISIGSSGHQTGNGCVDVTFPVAIGGQEIYECGARAQALCASVNASAGRSAIEDRAVAAQCRKAGLKVG